MSQLLEMNRCDAVCHTYGVVDKGGHTVWQVISWAR